MKKLLVILMIALIPSLAFSASATVGGTLKVYAGLTAVAVKDIVFPAQFVGAVATGGLTNTDGLAPATGIPIVAPNIGQAGKVTFSGSGGVGISLVNPTALTINNAANVISAIPVYYAPTAALASAITTATLSGSWGGTGTVDIFIGATIPSGTAMVAGTYTGTHTVTANYL
ncbi:MAG: hypothetical protein WCQ47_03345 [bacterium]